MIVTSFRAKPCECCHIRNTRQDKGRRGQVTATERRDGIEDANDVLRTSKGITP